MNKPKLLLSLNGGGLRGVFTARILWHIERELKKQAYELFEMIAGNSTGAILATALGRGFTAEQAVELYLTRGQDIFAKKPFWQRLKGGFGILDETYDLNNLVRVMREYMKEDPLSKHKTKVMTAAFDLAEWKPYFFKSWKEDQLAIPMWVSAVASGVPPTYFEPLQWGNHLFVDGGVTGVNNMSACLAVEAKKVFGVTDKEIKILNIGTGQYREKISPEMAKKLGKIRAIKPVIEMQMDGTAEVVVYQSKVNLGGNYLEVDVTISKELAPMDNYKNCPDLVKIADRVWEQKGKEILEFLKS